VSEPCCPDCGDTWDTCECDDECFVCGGLFCECDEDDDDEEGWKQVFYDGYSW
jgi:hypothetical protein